MGVELTVLGDERALRIDGTAGEALLIRGVGAVKRENLAGLTNPASLLILDFLVGELKTEGSTFSESTSSKISGARWRFPVDGVGVGFKLGEAKLGEIAMDLAFSLILHILDDSIYHSACS